MRNTAGWFLLPNTSHSKFGIDHSAHLLVWVISRRIPEDRNALSAFHPYQSSHAGIVQALAVTLEQSADCGF
jgi:hypothetical protein